LLSFKSTALFKCNTAAGFQLTDFAISRLTYFGKKSIPIISMTLNITNKIKTRIMKRGLK